MNNTKDFNIPKLSLGAWAFGGDTWWGTQYDKDSMETMEAAVEEGICFFDTAPLYGKGRSERLIGDFIRKRRLRDKIQIATKAGLSWEGSKVYHDLSSKRILEEIDESRERLQTDYIDLYQVHWPSPENSIRETAETFLSLKDKGIIKKIGVSNYSVSEMKEFMKYAPIDTLQSEYSLFNRSLEEEIIPFCIENNIGVLSYSPLYSGLLTGKFFLKDEVKVPDDRVRREKADEFAQPRYEINRKALKILNRIAEKYNKSLSQLVLNWNHSQEGLISAIAGARRASQMRENAGALNWDISKEDMREIRGIAEERDREISEALIE